jgi:hypothetical protein
MSLFPPSRPPRYEPDSRPIDDAVRAEYYGRYGQIDDRKIALYQWMGRTHEEQLEVDHEIDEALRRMARLAIQICLADEEKKRKRNS